MCDTRKKVLIITPFYAPCIGGAETFAEDLLRVSLKYAHIHVCTLNWKKPLLWEGTNIRKGLEIVSKILPKAVKACSKNKYDTIHCLGLNSALVGVILKKFFNIKLLVSILALYDFKKIDWKVKWILNQADKIFVEGNMGELDLTRVGVNPKKMIQFHHWVDQNRFKPINLTEKKGISVLFVGRKLYIKGRHIIEGVEKMCKNLPIKFTYVENVPYDILHKYYQNADIFVIPSLYSEGFARVVSEAASCGCVVIASNNGALPELVLPFGIVVQPTIGDFYKNIIKLYVEKPLLKEMREKTISYANEHFNDKNAMIFINEY